MLTPFLDKNTKGKQNFNYLEINANFARRDSRLILKNHTYLHISKQDKAYVYLNSKPKKTTLKKAVNKSAPIC